MSIDAGSCTIVPDTTLTGEVTRLVGSPVAPEPLSIIGTPSGAVELYFLITVGGKVGEGRFKWKEGAATSWPSGDQVIPSGGILNMNVSPPTYVKGGQIGLGSTGVQARFADATYVANDSWSWSIPHAIGYPVVTGTEFALELGQVEAQLWWSGITLRGTLPDPYGLAGPDFDKLYGDHLAKLAARVNALAAVFAPRLV